ncbi:hypothetical protein AB0H00_31925, partial [Nocardia sp. NPDC023852]|uniref:hypothetical protein n=1 Tax=Nocardia sp. NPDC023852 TaxID=3154697 RepID=UPI0033CBAE27
MASLRSLYDPLQVAEQLALIPNQQGAAMLYADRCWFETEAGPLPMIPLYLSSGIGMAGECGSGRLSFVSDHGSPTS